MIYSNKREGKSDFSKCCPEAAARGTTGGKVWPYQSWLEEYRSFGYRISDLNSQTEKENLDRPSPRGKEHLTIPLCEERSRFTVSLCEGQSETLLALSMISWIWSNKTCKIGKLNLLCTLDVRYSISKEWSYLHALGVKVLPSHLRLLIKNLTSLSWARPSSAQLE